VKAWDIIAWTRDGAIYCADHGPQSAMPVFASEISDVANDVCDVCREPVAECRPAPKSMWRLAEG